MITFRKAHPSLRGEEFEVLYSDEDTLVYLRGNDAIVTINRNPEAQHVTLDKLAGDWHLAFSTFDADVGDMTTLPPRSGRVFLKSE